jgi:hypothetical protein
LGEKRKGDPLFIIFGFNLNQRFPFVAVQELVRTSYQYRDSLQSLSHLCLLGSFHQGPEDLLIPCPYRQLR